MQMMKPRKSSAKIVWTYGTICGVCVSTLWLIGGLVLSNVIGDAVWTVLYAILGVSLVVAGTLASRQTGQMLTGMQAGIVAGLTGVIIIGTISTLIIRPIPSLASLVVSSAVLVVFALGGGAVMGEIGGLIGYRQYLKDANDS